MHSENRIPSRTAPISQQPHLWALVSQVHEPDGAQQGLAVHGQHGCTGQRSGHGPLSAIHWPALQTSGSSILGPGFSPGMRCSQSPPGNFSSPGPHVQHLHPPTGFCQVFSFNEGSFLHVFKFSRPGQDGIV